MMRSLWTATLVVLLGLPAAAAAEELLVRAAGVYTAAGKTWQPGAVLIRDGKIVEVAAEIEPPAGARLVDLGDGVLMPGLINAYSQAGVAGGDSEYSREITPGLRIESVLDWESKSFGRACADGVTTLGIMPGTENVIAGQACVVKSAGAPAERIVRAPAGLVATLASDPTSRNSSRRRPDSIYVRQPTNRMGVVWLLRSSLDQARRDDPRLGGRAPLQDVLAGRRRLFLISRSAYDLQALFTVSDEFSLQPVVIGGDEAYQRAEELAARKMPVVLSPLTTGTDTGREGTRLAWNQAGLLHEAGVAIAFSGDQLLEQARFAIRRGLPEEAALEALTAVPARILGVGDRVGSIAVGRDADLVALNGEPWELDTTIHWVMVNGRIQGKDE